MDIVSNIEAALVFAFIGIVVFVLSFTIIDRLTHDGDIGPVCGGAGKYRYAEPFGG